MSKGVKNNTQWQTYLLPTSSKLQSYPITRDCLSGHTRLRALWRQSCRLVVLCIEKQKGKQNRHKVNNEIAKSLLFGD